MQDDGSRFREQRERESDWVYRVTFGLFRSDMFC